MNSNQSEIKQQNSTNLETFVVTSTCFARADVDPVDVSCGLQTMFIYF